MMKKIAYILIMLIAFGCSSNAPKSSNVEVMKNIEGPLGNYLEVISQSSTLQIEKGMQGNYALVFSVQLKVNKAIKIDGGYENGSPYGPIIEYMLFDDKKIPIKIDGFRILTEPDINGIASNIGMQDNSFWLQFSHSFVFDTDSRKNDMIKKMNENISKAKYVQVTSRIIGDSPIGNLTNSSSTGAINSASTGPSYLTGIYQGAFGSNQILINLETISNDGTVSGYNELKGKRRTITGLVTPSGTNYNFTLKEPGDEEWDGVFTFVVSDNIAKGTWQANNGKLQREYILTKKSESGSSSVNETEMEKSSKESLSECDEFLAGYEKFMSQYIAILKKYKNNPTDMSIVSDYTSMMTESTEWADKADKLNEECAKNPTFVGKYTEIQMKIANAAAGM